MNDLKFDPKREITYFGKTNHRNSELVFGIKRKDRRQHMYVLGKSGTGKSVLLSNMIIQNIVNDEGVCVVDPHGELVETILESIPEERLNDVIYFNPADTDSPVGFNVFEMSDPKYKHLVASGLMGIFTKIWANVWSSRMEYILNNAILALLDTPGTTLLGIPRLLVDKEYRKKIIDNLKDPIVKAFWITEYELWQERFRNEAIAPIQNKVGQFLSSSIIRNVVGQSKSTIDIFKIMNEGKILLVNVSKGRVGEDNSALLGGMIITKIQLAAMERVRIPEEERLDFYLFVDEFQNFATESFANILSEARKYRLNLILAHQYIAQLATAESTSVRDAVFGNVGTMITFRVGAADAEFLEKEFEPEFTIQDMVNLPNHQVYLKLMVDGVTSRPFSALTLPPFKTPKSENMTDRIIETSRRLYTRSREEVESDMNKWSGMVIDEETETPEGKFKTECSSCKNLTFVPFEPLPGRSVYCRDCLGKIKNGDLQPVQVPSSNSNSNSNSNQKQDQKQNQKQKRDKNFHGDSKDSINENKNNVNERSHSERPVLKVESKLAEPRQAEFKPEQRPEQIPEQKPEQKPEKKLETTAVKPMVKPTVKKEDLITSDKTDLQSVLQEALTQAVSTREAQFKRLNKFNDASRKEVPEFSEVPRISLAEMKKNTSSSISHTPRISHAPRPAVTECPAYIVPAGVHLSSKQASDDNRKALQDALAQAMAKVASKPANVSTSTFTPTSTSTSTPTSASPDITSVPKTPIIENQTSEKDEQKNDSQNNTREVPEDVLRKILE